MLDEIEVLKDVSERLEHAGIAYMLTGSVAMNYYAEPRMTRDIDIVVALETGDATKVRKTFEPDYYVPADELERALEGKGILNVVHIESVVKVVLIIRKSDEYRQAEFARRHSVAISNFHAWIVSKEDLILSKLLWARDSRSEMQFRDVRNLLATGVDSGYLDTWAQTLGINDLLRECRDEH